MLLSDRQILPGLFYFRVLAVLISIHSGEHLLLRWMLHELLDC